MLTGCTWHSGDGAGLPNDTAISRTIKEALERRLIEVRQVPTGTLYAIHRRFWALTKLKPVWTIYKRLPCDETADPLTLESVTITMIAEQAANEEDSSSPAIIRLAGGYHNASSLLSPGQQPVITMIAEKSSEAAPEEGRNAPKKTSQERDKERKKQESSAASPRSPSGSPMVSEEDEAALEEQPDLMTLRVEYTTLSHQLAQLDVN